MPSFLLLQKNFLIFDEATSEIDVELENKIYKNIKNYKSDLIILLTNHKNNNFSYITKVLNLDKGKITIK